MAEIKLLLDRKDSLSIARTIFDSGAYMVPACNYDEPKYFKISSLKDFQRLYETTKLFFIIHKAWESEPLEMKEFDHKEFGKKYFIVQKSGGPTIDFFSSGEYKRDGVTYIGTGFLGYHSKYWSAKDNTYVNAPDKLKAFYKEMVSDFKKNAKRLSGSKVSYWISMRSKQRIDSSEMYCALEFLTVPPDNSRTS